MKRKNMIIALITMALLFCGAFLLYAGKDGRQKQSAGEKNASVALRQESRSGAVTTKYATKVAKKELKLSQAKALSKLEQYKGQYDKTSIVLENTSKKRAKQIAADLGAKLRITKDGKYAQLTLPKGTSISDVYADKKNLSYISDMSPDWIAEPAEVTQDEGTQEGALPDDSLQDSQDDSDDAGLGEKSSDLTRESVSKFNDPLYSRQTYYNYMNMGNVLSQKSDRKIKVAIIDSGIDIDHPEFKGIISERSYNASTDQVAEDYGMDVVQDCMGHGTVCAGMIAAANNNNEGIVGVNNNVELVVIKCETNPDKTFKRSSDINFGLAYAIEQNVDVVSMSIGGGGPSNPYAKYCQLAVDSDITVVASAGNDTTATPSWPAADPNVIGVGALEENAWTISWYSNFGDNSDIMAPGRVLTTQDGGGYTMVHGTSLATPLVAGVVARFYATHSNVTYSMVKELLEASAKDLGDQGEDWIYGFGAMDVDTFINGDIGKVTFDYMTDDIKNTTQLFYRNHILQNFPEPERDGVVFAGWYLDEQCTEPFDNLTTPLTEDTTFYAAWENEDEGVPYEYTEVNGGVEITRYKGKRKYVTVPSEIDGKTVVGIGSQAFQGLDRLVRVELPDTLTYIGYLSFADCGRLSRIDIPDNVKGIGNGAFENCVLLSAVNISENTKMESIGEGAFAKCSSLRSFYLGKHVTGVGGDAFQYASGMQTITLQDGNTAYALQDGTLYTSDFTTAVYRPAAQTTAIKLDSRTQTIGKYAFNSSKASGVSIPEGVVSIGKSAFEAGKFEKITLPSTVTDLGTGCFSLCSYLSEFDFGGANISVLPDMMFKSCSSLTQISIPESVTSIGSDKTGEVFYGCALEKVTWAENCQVQEIKPRSFYCNPLAEISIPASIEVIGMQTFQFCWNLSDVSFAKDSKLQSIYPLTFWCCYSLKELNLPASVETLYHSCFAYSGLESLRLPKNLSKIEEEVFQECTNFAEITVDPENTHFVAEDNVLYNKAKTTLVLYPCARKGESFEVPAGVTGIAQYAFYGASNLKEVTLPEDMTSLGGFAFSHCRSLESINLPDSLVTIGLNAFEYCTSLSAFALPATVKTIGRYAFYCCSNLESVRAAQDAALTRIGYAAFAYTGIKTFSMPATVSSMGQLVFSGCSNLQEVHFVKGSKLTSISAWMFDGADSLKKITFDEDSALNYVSARAFEHLKALVSVDLSNCKKLQKIGNYAFNTCLKLEIVTLPENVEEIGRYSFYNCRNLSRLQIPVSVNKIAAYAFGNTKDIELFFDGTELPKNLETNWNYGVKGYYLGASDKTVSGDWVYVLHSDDTVSVCGYRGSETALDLKTVDGHVVSSIGFAAFRDSAVESIKLYSGITSIGDYAFAGTKKLTTLEIPDTCTYIGSHAFDNAGIEELTFADNATLSQIADNAFVKTSSLGDVVLPASVENIGDKAFYKSGIHSLKFEKNAKLKKIETNVFAESSLAEITLPDQMERIDSYAFYNTKALKNIDFGNPEKLSIRSYVFYGSGIESVTIPKGISYIGEMAFVSCANLQEFTVDAENEWYSSENGVLYNKKKTTLITYPAGREESVTIPSNTASIQFGAFENAKVTKVSFEAGSKLVTIGYRAFYQCTKLTDVTVPESLLSFDSYAFAECSALENVNIQAAKNLVGIYNSAFYGCTKLTGFEIPDTVFEIGDYAFYDCKSATAAIGSDSKLVAVGDHSFAHSGIESFVAGENMLGIGEAAFQGSSLTKFDLSNAALTYIGSYAFDGISTEQTELVIPETVNEIGYRAFGGVHTIQELTMPIPTATDNGQSFTIAYLFGGTTQENVIQKLVITAGNAVAADAFKNLTTLTEVTLADEIESIGEGAFYNTSITTIKLPSSLQSLGREAFVADSKLTSISLPDSLRTIGERCFLSCTSLKGEFVIPKSVTSIGNAFISDTKIDTITVEEGNTKFCSVDGILYDQGKTKLITCPVSYRGEVQVVDSVIEIESFGFDRCSGITKLTLSKNLKKIGANAFSSTSIKELAIPAGVVSMGDRILAGSTVETVIFEEGVTTIPYMVLGQCDSLKKVVVPGSVEKIGDLAFNCCPSLEEVDLQEGIVSIGAQAFKKCSSLQKLSIPASVKEIGAGFVASCTGLKEIDIAKENTSYKMLGNLVVDNAERTVYGMLPSYTGTLEIPNGIETIGDHALSGCLMDGIVIPDSVKTIEDNAFNASSNIKNVKLGKNIIYLGMNLFDNNVLEKYKDKDGVVYIDNYLLASTKNELSDYCVKEGTEGIANAAFQYRDKLTGINIPQSVKFIGVRSFDSTSLESLRLPKNLKYIYPDAFSNISDLNTVAFENGFKADMWVEKYGAWYGSGAFENDPNIETIIVSQTMLNKDGQSSTLALSSSGLSELGYRFNWSTYRFEWYGSDKIRIIIQDADTPVGDIDVSGVYNANIYTYEDEESSLWHKNWGEGNKVYYLGAWNMVTYMAGDVVAKVETVKKGSVIQPPSSDLIKDKMDDICNFTWKGWDIDGDGKADTLPTTLLEDLTAAAVYQVHDWKQTDTKEPTCTENGTVSYSCSVCGKTKEEEIEATGHSYVAVSTVEPTETEDGYTEYECSVCKDTYKGDYVLATGDTLSDWKVIKEASCTENGTEGRYSLIGGNLIEEREIPATGHSAGEWIVITPAECEKDGEQIRRCTICNLILDTETIPGLEHEYGAWEITKEATTEYEGERKRECSLCGHIEYGVIAKLEKIEPNGAQFKEDQITMTVGDVKSLEVTFEPEDVTETDITWSSSNKEVATVDEYGSVTAKAKGDVVITATTINNISISCNITVVAAPCQHDWEEDYTIDKPATCEGAGSKSIHCKNCEAVKDSTEIPATGHSFGEWETVKSPTCEDGGSKKRECSVCGKIETLEVDPNGHDWEEDYTIDKPATTEEEGSESIHCKNCEAVKDSRVIPALPKPSVTPTPAPSETPSTEPNQTPSPSETPSKEPKQTPSPRETPSAAPSQTPSPSQTPVPGTVTSVEPGQTQAAPTAPQQDLKKQTIRIQPKDIKVKKYKVSKLKKKKAVFKITATAEGAVTYKVTKGSQYITVSKKGKVTVKKKTKKGTYTIRITAAQTSVYAEASRTVKVQVQ